MNLLIYHIDLNILTLSSTGGCVLKRFANINLALLSFLKGLLINRWAVELDAFLRTFLSAAIFSKARAKPSGYLVMSAPDASAKNSLLLETASWMIVAMSGVKINTTMTKIIIKGFLLSLLFSSLLNPPHQRLLIIKSETKATVPTNTATIEETKIS